MSIELFFFPFLFSGYFHSVRPRVASIAPGIISGDFNQSSSALFDVIFESLYRCLQYWHILFLLLFSKHIICLRDLWDVTPSAWSLVFLFSGPFV